MPGMVFSLACFLALSDSLPFRVPASNTSLQATFWRMLSGLTSCLTAPVRIHWLHSSTATTVGTLVCALCRCVRLLFWAE
jgi:hypothetical protein